MKGSKRRRRRKPRYFRLRFRKNDPVHNVLAAVQHYVLADGGQIVVIGGIGIVDEEHPLLPGTAGKFRVCVSCLGRKPPDKRKGA